MFTPKVHYAAIACIPIFSTLLETTRREAEYLAVLARGAIGFRRFLLFVMDAVTTSIHLVLCTGQKEKQRLFSDPDGKGFERGHTQLYNICYKVRQWQRSCHKLFTPYHIC